jgi:Lrp/AsnC family transcriptional regulator, leucine-responsive regulatory protein
VELADRVGLSPSACLRRVQELERKGVIAGYRAVIDRAKLGAGFTSPT